MGDLKSGAGCPSRGRHSSGVRQRGYLVALAVRGYKARKAGSWTCANGIHDTLIWTKKGTMMAKERTLSIIKPDATERNITGEINSVIEKAGLRIVAQKRARWKRKDAEAFYAEHKERPFFKDLCKFMTSGPIILQVLEGEGAIKKYRELMGATDPAEAKRGTLRKKFAESKGRNAVHGSDSPKSATREIRLNFRAPEIVG
jgi:nucleoside-diphosphate kinase